MFEEDEIEIPDWVNSFRSSMETSVRVENQKKGVQIKKQSRTFIWVFIVITLLLAGIITVVYMWTGQNTEPLVEKDTQVTESQTNYVLTTETILKTEKGIEPIKQLHINKEKRTYSDNLPEKAIEDLKGFVTLLQGVETVDFQQSTTGQYLVLQEDRQKHGILYDLDLDSTVGFIGEGFTQKELGILKEKYPELYTYKLVDKVVLAFTPLLTEESNKK